MRHDKFCIGQRVVWTSPFDRSEFRATVISQREPRRNGDSGRYSLVYRLDVDGRGPYADDGMVYASPQRELRPLYDGDQVVSWTDCAWRPREVCHGGEV